MRFVGKLSFMLFGLSLLVITIGGSVLRQQPSTAFWALGVIQDQDQQYLYLSTPNSGVRRLIATSSNSNRVYPVDWFPDGDSFYYLRQFDLEYMKLYRFNLKTFKSTPMADHHSATTNRAGFLSAIPYSNQYVIILDSATGSIIHRVSTDGAIIEPISPNFESISSINWTHDGEWIYYIAGEGGNLTNGLYRQHFDGSDFEELMQFHGTAFLTPTQGDSDIFLFSVYTNSVTFGRQVYRISSTEDVPRPITPSNQNFSLAFQTINEWVVLNYSETEFGDNQLFRVNVDGGNLAPLYPPELAYDIVEIVYPISRDRVIINIYEDEFAMLYEVNLETLERRAITPPDTFTQISNARLIADGTTIIFEGGVETDLAYYRADTADNTIRKVVDLAFTQIRNNISLYFDNIGVYLEPIDKGNGSRFYRIDFISGEQVILAEFDVPLFNINLAVAPPHIGGVILTVYGDGRIAQQLWIDPVVGSLRSVYFGSDLRFSPIIDTEWNARILIALGVIILFLTFGWIFVTIGRNTKIMMSMN